MQFSFGDVVLVRFPFTNQIAFKQRPAVVVSSQTYNSVRPDVIIMPVTSQLRPTGAFGEVMLVDWSSAGLLKPSAIKPIFATLEQALLLKRLGSLEDADQKALRHLINTLLG